MFEYVINLIILFAIYAILGISLNLIVGYTGLLSVSHAAFYGIGAYTTAILLTGFGVNFFVSVILPSMHCANDTVTLKTIRLKLPQSKGYL